MMTPDELWEKYRHGGVIGKSLFKIALSEYGQHIGEAVRKRDAQLCRSCFGTGSGIVYHHSGNENCAAAIEREPLPT